jgi:CheY-like chemotaxis protein
MNSLFSNRGTDESDDTVSSSGALPMLFALLVMGFIGILIYALASADSFLSIVSVGTMVAGASLLVGGFFGFLFGIPRTLVYDRLPSVDKAKNSDEDGRPLPEFDPNTNLEQISDWLTKILVGVGLTQLGKIPLKLQQAANTIEAGLGSAPQNHVFALAILIYFPMCGFFVGYLWARLFLPNALARAARKAKEERERKEREVSSLVLEAQEVKERAKQKAPKVAEEGIENIVPKKAGLWVDDNPSNNTSLKQAFESLHDIEIDLSLSTEDALQKLDRKEYSFIISDMGRQGDPRAAYTLLHKIKDRHGAPPCIIYATGASDPAHRAEAKRAGAMGSTSSPLELRQLVKDALGTN